MTRDLMTFRYKGPCPAQMLMTLMNKVNCKPWQGKDPRTCQVVDVHISMIPGGIFGGTITVRHRPDGWRVRRIDQTSEGEFLDGHGNPLPEGQEKVVLEWEVPHEEVDFNQFDFGELVPSEG